MSFFGKLKNLHSGPPAPPKRIDKNAGYGWPEDEFDEEDGDTYEAPPCERAPVKVPPRQMEENVYLERTSNPVVPQRQAAPPSRPAKVTPMGKGSKQQHDSEQFYFDPNSKRPPEIDRKEKPGKRSGHKKAAPPPVRPVAAPAPLPTPAPASDEDVYLDPNEGQGDNDELYLEPTAACPPAPRGLMRIPTPPKAAAAPFPVPMMKPPVPRAKSSSLLPSFSEVKSAPLDVRRATFPAKFPPPTPGVKPPLPANLKELNAAKPSPPPPPIVDTKTAASPIGTKPTKQAGNEEDHEWFAKDCDRKTAEELLLRVNKDGAFLIRHSSAQNSRQPYTLAVLYRGKVYNIPIRFLEETQCYALGKDGKKNQEIFSCLQEMIFHHENNQLALIDSKSQAKHTTYLTHPARQ